MPCIRPGFNSLLSHVEVWLGIGKGCHLFSLSLIFRQQDGVRVTEGERGNCPGM